VNIPPENFFRVGVTGGIGSGKSTVCRLLTQFGRTVLSADAIARDITNNDREVHSAILREFGPDVFHQNGSLLRDKLAEIVFADSGALEKLNALVHPHVFAALEQSLLDLKPEQRMPYIVIEAALIYETRMDDDLSYVIVVTADEDTRIRRVMNRDKMTRQEVRARMRSQMDEEKKIELADFVIINDGTEADLIERVQFIDKLLPMMAAPQVARKA